MDSAPSRHLAPVVVVPHHVGPDGWSAALGVVAATLEAHPSLPLTVRVPGAALSHVVGTEPAIWETLSQHEISWLAGGWSDPVLADLPMTAARLQLHREKTALAAAGVDPVGLWLGACWEPLMTSFAIESGFRLVFLDAGLLTDDLHRPGAADRAGDTVIVVPVVASSPEKTPADGLTTVRVLPGELRRFCEEHAGRLTTPDRYLADHRPGGRVVPQATVPSRSADAESYYRKLLRVIDDQSDRSAALDLVLALESREFTAGGGGGIEASHRLLRARTAVDRARHRGDSWVRVVDVDWNGDGVEEIQVETRAATLVLDATQGQIIVWDDKTGGWPITSVAPAMAGTLVRRMDEAGAEPPNPPMWVDRRSEGRAEARLNLTDAAGGRCRLVLAGRGLTIQLNPVQTDPVMLGPELPVLLAADRARLRVDGGDWLAASEPVAASGHRFRLTDDENTLLISSPRPCDIFVRPSPGLGLLVWPHWPSTGEAEYQVTFEVG